MVDIGSVFSVFYDPSFITLTTQGHILNRWENTEREFSRAEELERKKKEKMAPSRRLYKEWEELERAQKQDPDIFLYPIDDNLLHWQAKLKGPADSPYEVGNSCAV
jgi:hypothetical protein